MGPLNSLSTHRIGVQRGLGSNGTESSDKPWSVDLRCKNIPETDPTPLFSISNPRGRYVEIHAPSIHNNRTCSPGNGMWRWRRVRASTGSSSCPNHNNFLGDQEPHHHGINYYIERNRSGLLRQFA